MGQDSISKADQNSAPAQQDVGGNPSEDGKSATSALDQGSRGEDNRRLGGWTSEHCEGTERAKIRATRPKAAKAA
jgi:hypothetical protein